MAEEKKERMHSKGKDGKEGPESGTAEKVCSPESVKTKNAHHGHII